MNLRPYQTAAKQAIQEQWQSGIKKTLMVLPTGTGKTIVFSKLAEDCVRDGERVLILAHRGELLDQAADKVAQATGLRCAVEKAENSCLDSWYRVTVGSVQTLMREKRLSQFPADHFGTIIVDECFPAGTCIDGKPIERLRIGDTVTCFDDNTREVKNSKITYIFKRKAPGALLKINISRCAIVCTLDHPIFTPRGWVKAKDIKEGDNAYVYMSTMWRRNDQQKSEKMFNLLSKGYGRTKPPGSPGEDEGPEPNERPRNPGENVRHSEADTAQATNQRRKRNGCNSAARQIGKSIGLERDGVCNTNPSAANRKLSNLLQNRYCKFKIKNSDRSGRLFPRIHCPEATRFEERKLLNIARVDSVEIFKQRDYDKFRQLCPDGYVYNIEVETYNTYFANGLAVHNCHHVLSDSYQRVLQHFNKSKVLGVTATPDRGDMRNLGQYFESLAYEYTLPKAIRDGHLCKIVAQTIPLKLDLTGVGIQAGDYKTSDLGTALDPYLYQIADEMAKVCMDRKTIVFLPLIKTSQKFCDILNSKGFNAVEVNGDSQDRAEKLKDFENGRYNVLTNSMLVTEGYDCPEVDCIVVLRPTKIRSLYAQMCGRGTRLHPGKDHLLLLDFLWHTTRHELCHPAHLICESPEVAEKMTETLEEASCPVDLEEAERKAGEDVVAAREEALAKVLQEMRTRKRKLVDPLQFEMSIQAEDLAGYTPSFGWECGPPSEKQIKTLEKLGIFPDQIENAGKANKLLDRLSARRFEGLTTPKQIRFLENKGFRHVGTWQFEEAKKMIDRIAGNGWRVPRGINPAEYRGGGGA